MDEQRENQALEIHENKMILTYHISQPIHRVFQHLADAQKFTEVHPVIYKAEHIAHNEYRFYECMRVCYIPFRFSYHVHIKPFPDKFEVLMTSQVRRGVHLTLGFSLETRQDKTIVTERVVIKAPPLIYQVFFTILKNAHRQLFDKLNSLD